MFDKKRILHRMRVWRLEFNCEMWQQTLATLRYSARDDKESKYYRIVNPLPSVHEDGRIDSINSWREVFKILSTSFMKILFAQSSKCRKWSSQVPRHSSNFWINELQKCDESDYNIWLCELCKALSSQLMVVCGQLKPNLTCFCLSPFHQKLFNIVARGSACLARWQSWQHDRIRVLRHN